MPKIKSLVHTTKLIKEPPPMNLLAQMALQAYEQPCTDPEAERLAFEAAAKKLPWPELKVVCRNYHPISSNKTA